MVDEDDRNNVRMPMGDREHVAVMDYSDEDDERRGENDDMDDLGEDFESDDDDDDGNDDDDDDEEEEEEEINYEIVQKFMRTFSNGDYDAEFNDALSSHRSATVLLGPHRRRIKSLIIGENEIGLDWRKQRDGYKIALTR